jgi:hypothetical protein
MEHNGTIRSQPSQLHPPVAEEKPHPPLLPAGRGDPDAAHCGYLTMEMLKNPNLNPLPLPNGKGEEPGVTPSFIKLDN